MDIIMKTEFKRKKNVNNWHTNHTDILFSNKNLMKFKSQIFVVCLLVLQKGYCQYGGGL